MFLAAVPDIQGTGNWILGIFTENGFKTVLAVWGVVGTILFGVGFAKGWWYTGGFVQRQEKMIDAQNVIMEASAKTRSDEQAERLKNIEETLEREFPAITRRDEVSMDLIRDIRAARGGGGASGQRQD